MPHALLFFGGWDGHEPVQTARLFSDRLQSLGYAVTEADSLNVLEDAEALTRMDLIVPMWTMGQLSGNQAGNLVAAVRAGTGLAGFHGGMGDAFRGCTDYEWMCGGHFVGHPHVGPYTVEVTAPAHPVMAGMESSFAYDSEQYYMLIDPGVEVLATTPYTYEGRTCAMPVVWTKSWSKGRVFYSALGHKVAEFSTFPAVLEMTLRGMQWATRQS